jgi:hypothetical protein
VNPSNRYSTPVEESPAPLSGLTPPSRIGRLADSPRLAWIVLALVTLLYVGTCFAPVIFDDNEASTPAPCARCTRAETGSCR